MAEASAQTRGTSQDPHLVGVKSRDLRFKLRGFAINLAVAINLGAINFGRNAHVRHARLISVYAFCLRGGAIMHSAINLAINLET